MPEMEKMTAETLAQGGLLERVDFCLKEVAENIGDINTDAEATREVNIKIKIKPYKNRELANYTIKAESKLASLSSIGGALFMAGKGKDLKFYEKQPNQVEMNLDTAKKIIKEEEKVND